MQEPAYQTRVRQEHFDLSTKYHALDDFILNSPVFKDLPAEDQLLLSQQKNVMSQYRDILKKRIERFPNS